MPQIVNLVLFAAGVISVTVALVSGRDTPTLVALLVLGVGLGVVAYISDEHRLKRALEKRLAEVESRIKQLTRHPWPSHQTLKVRGSVATALLVLAVASASAVAIYAGVDSSFVDWPLVLAGAFFLAVSLLVLPNSIGGVVGPACELDHKGFTTPIHGKIPWDAVTGIDIQSHTFRGITVHSLLIRVERYRSVVSKIHWTERVLAPLGIGALRRGVIPVVLKDPHERPETIHAVASFLWREATGRNRLSTPPMRH